MITPKGALTLTGIRKDYGGFLLNVSMVVAQGALVSLLGPSGSGKTSTLRIIAGFERVDSGVIRHGGRNIALDPPFVRRFGYVPQDLVLFPHLNVAGNVGYGLRAMGTSKNSTLRRVAELLTIVGLAGFEKRRVETLSGGEGQRVALARALAIDPAILLLDEPFSALDAPLRREMRGEVLRIRKELGISIVFVTHNQDEALAISDHIVLMHEGSVVQAGSPESLFRAPAGRFAAEFIGAANTIPVFLDDDQGNLVALEGGYRLRVEQNTATADRGERLLLVRPHCFSFGPGDAVNSIPAVITSRRFLGDRYEYECGTGERSFTVIDGERRDLGLRVHISFDPADGYLVPR